MYTSHVSGIDLQAVYVKYLVGCNITNKAASDIWLVNIRDTHAI